MAALKNNQNIPGKPENTVQNGGIPPEVELVKQVFQGTIVK
jgi:hypothetical protein